MTTPEWQPDHVYAPGDRVVTSTGEFVCVVGGTSAALTWRDSYYYLAGDVVRAEGQWWRQIKPNGVSGTVGPRLSDLLAGDSLVEDGTCVWTPHHVASYGGPQRVLPDPPPATSRTPWLAGQTYETGAVVDNDGHVWRCIEAGRTRPCLPWQRGVLYRVGTACYVNGKIWICTSEGTSSASNPPTVAGVDPQTDGTCQWTREGDGPPGPRRVNPDTIVDGTVTWQRVHPFDPLADGSVTWAWVRT